MIPAQQLNATQRQGLALAVLQRYEPLTKVAKQFQVSRKFLYALEGKAYQALEEGFSKAEDDQPLFWLPVSKSWLRQFILCLVMHGRASYRGVMKSMMDLLDLKVSLGTIANVVSDTIRQVGHIHAGEDLSQVKKGAHDEIYHQGKPVLVGIEVDSHYCYLLSEADHRDQETWAIHWWDLEEKGFQPDWTVADFGNDLRQGQKLASPQTPCRGDHFHIYKDLKEMLGFFRNRLQSRNTKRLKLEAKMEKSKKKKRGHRFSSKLVQACKEEAMFAELVRDLTTLSSWLMEDVLSLEGPDLATRRDLYDFIVEELEKLERSHAPRIRRVRVKLSRHREDLLAFAQQLEEEFGELAQKHRVPKELVIKMARLKKCNPYGFAYHQRANPLRKILKHRFYEVERQVKAILAGVVRSSSVVENYNSRLRSYFTLRKEIGHGYLDLLRFYLNHTPFLRSHRVERQGKSPKEILTGEDPVHWLDMLGYQRFKQAA